MFSNVPFDSIYPGAQTPTLRCAIIVPYIEEMYKTVMATPTSLKILSFYHTIRLCSQNDVKFSYNVKNIFDTLTGENIFGVTFKTKNTEINGGYRQW